MRVLEAYFIACDLHGVRSEFDAKFWLFVFIVQIVVGVLKDFEHAVRGFCVELVRESNA